MPARNNPVDDLPEGVVERCRLLEEQTLEMSCDHQQAVLEVHFHLRLIASFPVAPEQAFALIREQPGQCDQDKVRKQLLLDAALALPVEVFNADHLFRYFVQFLNAPTLVVEVGQFGDAVLVPVQQRGSQQVGRTRNRILHQAQPHERLLPARPGGDLDHCVGLGTVGERGHGAVGIHPQPEHRMQAPGEVLTKQRLREVATVVHHHIVFRQRVQMRPCGLPFVAMGDQVKIHRDPRTQPIQATEQALGVVGVVRRQPVTGLEQRPWQVQLRAVHGEQPMPLPARPAAGVVGAAEQFGVQHPKQVLVYFGPGVAHRRGRHRRRLRQRDTEQAALVPQFDQGRPVPLPVFRKHQAEEEQHHEQRVQRTLTPLPLPVEVVGHRHHRIQQRPPRFDPGVRRTLRCRRVPRSGSLPRPQQRLKILIQRVDENAFRRSHRPLAPGLA